LVAGRFYQFTGQQARWRVRWRGATSPRAKWCANEDEMRTRVFPILVDLNGRRIATGLKASAAEQPVAVALRLRDRGWDPYRVSFDSQAGAWLGLVLERHERKPRARADA
jgi:hypothetical protein